MAGAPAFVEAPLARLRQKLAAPRSKVADVAKLPVARVYGPIWGLPKIKV